MRPFGHQPDDVRPPVSPQRQRGNSAGAKRHQDQPLEPKAPSAGPDASSTRSSAEAGPHGGQGRAPHVHPACTSRAPRAHAPHEWKRTCCGQTLPGSPRDSSDRPIMGDIFRRSGFPSGGPCLGYCRPANVTGVTCAAGTCAASDARGESAHAAPRAPPAWGPEAPDSGVHRVSWTPQADTHRYTHT